MKLPINPPLRPMLAKSVPTIPEGMFYEPKFDGFRCIVFRDGSNVELGSRNERPLTRYFPEIVAAALKELPERCVIDGEVVVTSGASLDFELLQQRIHPAQSRVNLLASQIPACFIAFDLLALSNDSLMDRAFSERRQALERAMKGSGPSKVSGSSSFFLTPSTQSVDLAKRWFEEFEGAGLDGVIAKPPDVKYVPDKRLMFKIKHERTTDCVVAGFRFHKSGPVVGSLLLGLNDDEGFLRPVGVAASFSALRRKTLLDEISPYRLKDGESHPWAIDGGFEKLQGGPPSRWNAGKDMSWEPLRPELVTEVSYDHMEGDRFRHVAFFKRWRPDRTPESCTFSQLDRPKAYDLSQILG